MKKGSVWVTGYLECYLHGIKMALILELSSENQSIFIEDQPRFLGHTLKMFPKGAFACFKFFQSLDFELILSSKLATVLLL